MQESEEYFSVFINIYGQGGKKYKQEIYFNKTKKKSGKTISEACKNVYGKFIRLMNILVVALVKKMCQYIVMD